MYTAVPPNRNKYCYFYNATTFSKQKSVLAKIQARPSIHWVSVVYLPTSTPRVPEMVYTGAPF